MIGTGAARPVAAVNGAHDMGGMHGFGPVAPEADEPVVPRRVGAAARSP